MIVRVYPDDQTDEWIAGDEPPVEVRTPGPSVIEADSWNAVPPPPSTGDYRGGRRFAAPGPRLWMIGVLVFAAIGAAVMIPWALAPGFPGAGPSPAIADVGEISATPSMPDVPGTSAHGAVAASPPRTSAAPSPLAEPPTTVTPTVMLLSRGRPTATSALENASLAGANAVDGNPSTRWGSAWSDPQWISVDLGAVYSITLVRLSWEVAYGRSYQIQTSVDNANWSTISTTANGDGGIDETTVSGTGRWVRVFGTKRATQWGYSLWELEIFGTAS
jgi:F5/8 type C domain-containing protein